jgi:AcrR family transcriptional regulator
MPRARLSPQQITDFRESMREVATRRFAALGYAGVTLRGLARELGCSPMTPYRYFRDKDEIFSMVRSGAYERFADSQESAAAEPAASPLERLRTLGEVYVAFALEEPDLYRVMFELDQAEAAGDPELEKQERRAWQPLRDAVEAGVECGELAGDVDSLAHLFWGATHGLVALHLAGKLRLGRSLEDLTPTMSWTLIRGARP